MKNICEIFKLLADPVRLPGLLDVVCGDDDGGCGGAGDLGQVPPDRLPQQGVHPNLYSVIVYCTVLYCNVLYCTLLYYIILFCTQPTVGSSRMSSSGSCSSATARLALLEWGLLNQGTPLISTYGQVARPPAYLLTEFWWEIENFAHLFG